MILDSVRTVHLQDQKERFNQSPFPVSTHCHPNSEQKQIFTMTSSLKPDPISGTQTKSAPTTNTSTTSDLTTAEDQGRKVTNLEDLSSRTISSPHELTDWVDSLLDTLQGRFDQMQGDVDQRMVEMSNRIDALESSIEELIQGHANGGNIHASPAK